MKDKFQITHEFLLLFLNLAQLKEQNQIIELFVNAINQEYIGLEIEYFDQEKCVDSECLPIKTYENNFGYFQLNNKKLAENSEFMPIIRNFVKMLAVILENCEREVLLLEKNSKSESEIKTLIDNLAGFIYRCKNDADWTMVYISGGIEALSGYLADDFIRGNYTYAGIIHSEDSDMVTGKVNQAIAKKEDFKLEYRIIKKNKSIAWVQERGRGVFKQNGELGHLEGFILDITEAKKVEKERDVYIKLLENMEKINRAIQQAGDVNQMLDGVAREMVDIFGVDRAWLLYPCNPDTKFFIVPVEYSRAEYPGGGVKKEDIPLSPVQAEVLRAALRSKEPIVKTMGTQECVDKDTFEQFGVQSQILSALRPRVGDAWLLGMHQCSYARVWSEEEKYLFAEISKRISDSLGSFVYLKNLKVSEQKLRLNAAIIENTTEAVYLVRMDDGEIIYTNPAFEKMFGYAEGKMLGKNVSIVNDPNIQDPEITTKQIMEDLNKYGKWSGEVYNIKKDKTRFLSYANVTVFEHEDHGKVLVAAHVDITERKLLEQALEKRVVAMSQPLDQAADIDFDVLFNIEEIQQLQDLFAKSANVASIITYPDGTPITKPSNFCRLCNDIIRKTEKGKANCFKSDAAIGKYTKDGPIIQHCFSGGLWDAGASITVGGKHIANWLIGQVRNEAQDINKMKKYAKEIGVDIEEFLKAFEEVPIMSKQQFQKVADTLFFMANLLSSSAYQNIQQARFISERKKAEDNLLSSNKRFEKLFDNMSSGVAIYESIENGSDFIFQDFNKAAERIEKTSRSDIIGKKVTDVFPGIKNYGLFDVFKRVFQTGNPEHFSNKIYKDQRIEGWRRNYIFKIPTGEIIAVYDDVTEQKKIEQQEKEIFAAQAAAEVEKHKSAELMEAYQELKTMQEQLLQAEKLASIGQLGAGVAHELNSPLAGVLSLLRSYAKEKGKSTKEYDDLREMGKACEHMAKIIKGLNSFSSQSTDEIEDVDCNKAIESTMGFTSYQLVKKGVQIEKKLSSDLLRIKANQNQIQQIVINMISNACDAVSKNGIFKVSTNNVKIDNKNYVEMLFEDNGCGISAEIIKKIFDPFFTTKRPGGGIGLGLSIVYKIVETNKGLVFVDSSEGKGTIFTIRFPAN